MGRLRITGYVDTDDFEPEYVDSSDPTGLSAEGYDNLIAGENNRPLKLTDLDDVEVTKED